MSRVLTGLLVLLSMAAPNAVDDSRATSGRSGYGLHARDTQANLRDWYQRSTPASEVTPALRETLENTRGQRLGLCTGVSVAANEWLCDSAHSAPQQRQFVTSTIVARAFRRIPLPESEIVIQPPGGRTLVNFDTLFRTEAHPVTRTVRLLGHRVQLRARPSSFVWRPGDGTVFTTTQPGRTYRKRLPMSSYVSHRYTEATSVRPRVDTTWSARFRVDGGPWRPVAGTVTIDGAPVELRVVEARAQLVAGR